MNNVMLFAFATALVAFGTVGAYLATRASTVLRAIRMRNAMLLQPSRPGDFTWTPDRVPRDFAMERMAPDPRFVAVLEETGINKLAGDNARALAIASHLVANAGERGAIQDEPFATYQKIEDGYGYCADYVKVYLVLLHAAGIFARHWAFSFDGFGGHGHTFVEFFDRARGKWQFVDVYNNFHAVDAATQQPLSALEFRERLLTGPDSFTILPNGPGRLGFRYSEKAYEYYRRGAGQWYLWWGNAMVSYYAHPAVRWTRRFSRVLAHICANVVGVQPHVHIYPAAEASDAGRQLLALQQRLRRMSVFAKIAAGLLVVAGVFALWRV